MRRRDFLLSTAAGAAGFHLLRPSFEPKSAGKPPSGSSRESSVLIKVLGTAQDGGLPQIGCYCDNCRRARADAGFSRKVACLGIFDLDRRSLFLVDATPDLRLQLDTALKRLRGEASGRRIQPDGLILTHAHIGHYTGLMFFGYEAMSAAGLSVHCSARMAEFLRRNGPWSQLMRRENIKLHPWDSGLSVSLTANVSVLPFPVPHRDEYSDTFGLWIKGPEKKLLYIPDIQNWTAWDRSLTAEVARADTALLDGTFFSPQELPGRDLSEIGHPFIRDTMRLLDASDEAPHPRVFFTHLNHSNPAADSSSAAHREILKRGFAVLSEGMEFFL